MKRFALLIVLGMLAGCQQPKPTEIGKYEVVMIPEGTMRINTVTGKTELMVNTDTIPNGSYAERNGKPLVWAEVKVASPY
ncbi:MULTISPECIES: hypothetical protein [unclassified Brevundimonas]|uniref:hypothetical protein n=1 Tax=unclassified Brevundimonas TaxID=2622653 RepID=UPI0025C3F0CD|nr:MULTISPECIES: hypothetical protein [unclassified Brevundimonas]